MSLWKLIKARWGASAGETSDVRLDAVTEALINIEYEHHEIHDGSHFFFNGYQDLASGNVLDFTWLMPNTTKWTHWTWNIDAEDELSWMTYENVLATNPLANVVTPLNNNRNSGTSSGTTMKYELQADIAAANADTDVSGGTLIGSGKTKSGGIFTAGGGSGERDNELILKQNTLYCLRFVAASAGFMNFALRWYEHTNRN